MDRLQEITWFAGIFEGEGTFCFAHGKPKNMAISMTDEDVLLRVQAFMGGHVVPITKRQEHWKDAWKWYETGQKSVEIAKLIQPYLLARRQSRCTQYIEEYGTMEAYQLKRKTKTDSLVITVNGYREQGWTQQQIADAIGKDRSYVSRLLRK